MALKFANNNSLSAITSLPDSISGGGMTLISTQTASSSATISFTSGIDSTYDEYVFKFYDIHPATDDISFEFNASTNGGSSYGVNKTTTFFNAYHNEAGNSTNLGYGAGSDLQDSTVSYQRILAGVGNGNDESGVATLYLFSPSSTTFVKHFISVGQRLSQTYSVNDFVAGYFNTTTAINAIQFRFASGNIDSGVIKLYGIS